MVVSSGTPELISVTIVTSIDRSEKHIVFPKLLAQNCHDYSAENTMYNRDREKHGTARLVIILYILYIGETIPRELSNVLKLFRF